MFNIHDYMGATEKDTDDKLTKEKKEYWRLCNAIAYLHLIQITGALIPRGKSYDKLKSILPKFAYFVKPEDAFDMKIPPEVCCDPSNIYLVFVEGKSLAYFKSDKAIKNMIPYAYHEQGTMFHPWLYTVNHTLYPQYENKSIKELTTMSNSMGWIQGDYECINPKKYISDVDGFDKIIKTKRILDLYLEEISKDHKNLLNVSKYANNVFEYTNSCTTDPDNPPAKNKTLGRTAKERYKKLPTFRSSWERIAFIYCDTEPNIIAWSSEGLAIPYISPKDGEQHKYYVDLIIWARAPDGTIVKSLVEIKPKKQTTPPKKTARKRQLTFDREMLVYLINKAKWDYGRLFAKNNNFNFVIWTEDELIPSVSAVFGSPRKGLGATESRQKDKRDYTPKPPTKRKPYTRRVPKTESVVDKIENK